MPRTSPLGNILPHAELPGITFAEQIMSMPAILHRRWTEDEVRRLIDDAPESTPRYELVDGELLVTPAPSRLHQRVVFELARILSDFVTTHAVGEVAISPSDVRLSPGLVVQPDLFVVPSESGRRPRADVPTTRLILAVEVLSPGSARFDRVVKRHAFQAAGVPEYWIVDVDARTIERWRPGDARPEVNHATMSWNPPPARESLSLDLMQFFELVSDD